MQQDSLFSTRQSTECAADASGTPFGGGAPAAQLGSSFERRALVHLTLGTKARVWGDPSESALEPVSSSNWGEQDSAAARSRLLHRCMFCGLESQTVEIHSRNDNHGDTRTENIGLADPICHRWQHLGELGKGNALLVYLPNLSPSDASHLLRTTLVALLSEDRARTETARKVLNWMASHHVYVADAWGSSDPAAFAAALSRTVSEDRDRRAIALSHLALIIHPDSLRSQAAAWRQELQRRHPEATWPELHHRITNAPT